MIGILSNNPDEIFLQKLELPFQLIDDFDSDNLMSVKGLFIDWVPKIPVYEDAWMKQASLLQSYIKTGIPIAIFDRRFSLTEKEVNWVKKFNVYLFEPALNSGRIGFRYLPEWISNFEISADAAEFYDVVYASDNVEYYLKQFEKWFKDYARLFPDKKVAFSSYEISDFKKEQYKNENLVYFHDSSIFNKGNFTVAIDLDESYKIGYFNPIYFLAMNMGCIPLLPVNHKYFHSMFKGLVVNGLNEMDYYVSLYGRVKDVIIEEIFDRVKDEWSEFTVDHAVDMIRNCYE
jgi:hypothetical protein